MKPLEFAQKQLKNAEIKQAHHWEKYEKFGSAYDLEMALMQAEKVKKCKDRIQHIKNKKPTKFMKEAQIYFMSKMHNIENEIINSHNAADKATAIIDEIIESDFTSQTKIRMIKLFLNDKITTLEIDALLTE